MNKQQKIFNILAKEQKPMKVEFSLMSDANKLISLFKSAENKVVGHIFEYGKAIYAAENLYEEILKDEQFVNEYYDNVESTLNKFKKEVKAIGLDESSIAELHELEMLLTSVGTLWKRLQDIPKIQD